MERFRPAAALVTTSSAGGPFVRIARWLAAGFEENGNALDVVWPEGPPGTERHGNVRQVRLGSGRASRSVRALHGYFEKEAPRLALVTPGYLAPFAVAAGIKTATTVVPWEAGFSIREVGELPLRMRVLPALQRLSYRRAPVVAAVSSHVAESLGPGAVVLPNPVDAGEIRALAGDPPKDAGFVVSAAGRLTPYKGYDVLLEGLALAASDLGDWRLRLAGEGPQREGLEREAARLGLADRVELLGFVENPYPMMRASSVFVQPSRSEGFGVGVVEALALGLPVVATASGGPEEVLDGGRFGLLVAPADADALAEALTRLATDEPLRAALAARSDEAITRYAPATIASAVLALAGRV